MPMMRTLAALAVTGLVLSACGIPVGPGGPYGSGGQGALPDPSQSLTGITISHPLGGSSLPAAVDRNGGATTMP